MTVSTLTTIDPQPKHGICACHYSETGWAETNEAGGCLCSGAEITCPHVVPVDRTMIVRVEQIEGIWFWVLESKVHGWVGGS